MNLSGLEMLNGLLKTQQEMSSLFAEMVALSREQKDALTALVDKLAILEDRITALEKNA